VAASAISWAPDDRAVAQPSQNAVKASDFSFGDRVQVLGLRGVPHTADGVGGMLGLASNGLDTLDAVRLDEAGRRRTGHRMATADLGRPHRTGTHCLAGHTGPVKRKGLQTAASGARTVRRQ
jgi:hypothetical protein